MVLWFSKRKGQQKKKSFSLKECSLPFFLKNILWFFFCSFIPRRSPFLLFAKKLLLFF